MATRSSPKTPSHPSNGYEVLEGRLSQSSAGRSLGRRRSICSSTMPSVAINNTNIFYSPDRSNVPTMELAVESPEKNSSSPFNSDNNTLAVAVSQEDDYDTTATAHAHDDAPVPSNQIPGFAPASEAENNIEDAVTTRHAKRRRRQSTSSTFEASKRTRRASLRLHDKGIGLVPTFDGGNTTDVNGTAFDSSSFNNNQPKPPYSGKKSEDETSMPPATNRHSIEKSPQDPSPSDDPMTNQDGAVLPPKETNQVVPVISSTSLEISISERGQEKLSRALDKIASATIGQLPSDQLVSQRKRKVRVQTSVLESSGMDDSSDGKDSAISSKRKPTTMQKNRRDTFDLSKKRGIVSSAKRMDLDVFATAPILNECNADQNFVTPRASSSVMAMFPDDHHHSGNDVVDTLRIEENTVVMRNLEYLSRSAIEAKITHLFPENMSQITKLPCVSARIFAVMNIVYEDEANFTPLLPLLHSLVNAEIVSLQNEEQPDTVCFINKKVCFSGFDYSSTITAVGDVVGQGGGDLRPSIDALTAVLEHAMKLPKPIHYLDVAIQCLHCMSVVDGASECLSKTMMGYFPSARFQKAIAYYLNEMHDLKLYLISKSNFKAVTEHTGIRNRLNDFVGRSIRYHLRELLNSIPESVVKFDVGECEERWGRAVDDGSISSILNFSLEKIHELMTVRPNLFEYGVQNTPEVFAREPTTRVFSMSNDELKQMDDSTYESLVIDITEARSFLFGARACSFVVDLLNCPGVKEHIDSAGGWSTVEAMASTLNELHLFEGSENEHFVQLRDVRDLLFVSHLQLDPSQFFFLNSFDHSHSSAPSSFSGAGRR